jgi:hypothetical protein
VGIYTADQIRAARQADLVAWLQTHGYSLKREGQNWRVPGHAGLLVQGNHFKHFSSGMGGNALDFLVDYLGYKVLDAVQTLIHMGSAQQPISTPAPPAAEKELQMPIRWHNHRRVIAYLAKSRGLPVNLIIELLRSKLLYQDDHGNCVFPCLDRRGEAKGAIIRGTCTDVRYVARAKGSDVSYGWHWPPAMESCKVVITESPIDAMSLAVIRPEFRSYHILALGGLHPSGVHRFLDEHIVKTVVLAFDSDQPGINAARQGTAELNERGYDMQTCTPNPAKDWNELLILNSDISSAQLEGRAEQ